MGKPHVMVVPYPAQGHVIPLLKFSRWLVHHGIAVTFAITEFNHRRVTQGSNGAAGENAAVNMVSFSDGMDPWEDRDDIKRVTEQIDAFMPAELESLIVKINSGREDGEKITSVIADWSMGFALQVAKKLGLRCASFGTAPATMYAVIANIPKLVSTEVVDDNGNPVKKGMVELSPAMPLMNPADFIWSSICGSDATRKIFFDSLRQNHEFAVKFADWRLCNSSIDLESGAFLACSGTIPIGPIQAAGNLHETSGGHFWQEDADCLPWLDQHPPNSVIYVAFGSSTVLNTTQFNELALGLELTGRPFLWVVRKGMAADVDVAYPKGFKIRTQKLGKIVNWAPQQQVLSHPSVACFVSHCGWNSTIEGISHGLPFLCWAYYADQATNQAYICDEWKVGLGFEKDERGIAGRMEIRDKVEQLLTDQGYKERALNLQEKTLASVKDGSSRKNFNRFVKWIKDLSVKG